jgi:hypothetical protein
MYLVTVDDQVYIIDADELHYTSEGFLKLHKEDSLKAVFKWWTAAIWCDDSKQAVQYAGDIMRSKGLGTPGPAPSRPGMG